MQLLQHFKELTLRPKNAKELKGLILQLAIQGKLTANWRKENPDVEPASELLKRIEKEKEQLIKEKKLKKEKKLPSIQDSEKPYDLVENWMWCRLQNIIKISSGKGLTAAKMDKTGEIPVYGGNGITGYHSLGNVEKPTIVIGRVGFYCGSIHLTENVAWVTDNAFITSYSESNIFRDFLLLLLRGTNLKENENATAQPVISGRKVYPIVVSLPPLEEQKEIVKVVETLFKEVEQLEQLTVARIGLKEDYVTSALQQLTANSTNQEWTNLQEHFKSFFNETTNIKKLRETILQLAVQGKLTADWRKCHPELVEGDFHAQKLLDRIQEEKAQLIADKKIKKEKALPAITEEEIPYELPEGWVWCRLGETGLINPRNKVDDDKEIGFIPMKSISQSYSVKPSFEKRDWASVKKSFTHFKNGDIAFAKITPCFENSKACVFSDLPNGFGAGTTELHVFRRLNDEIYSNFIYSLFKSPHFLEEGEKKMTGSAGQKRVPKSYFSEYVFGLPPLEEQKAIVEKVNSLMGLCDALEQEVEQSQQHSAMMMQSVLKEVFEGGKEVEV